MVPEAVPATDAEGAAAIDAVVARRRSHLARLSLAARTAQRHCEQAEADAASQSSTGAGGRGPEDLLAVVDAMLEKAVRASEVALDQARSDALLVVATAMGESAEALRREGIDPGVLSSAFRAPSGVRPVTTPPTAAELWQRARPSSNPGPGRPAPMAATAPTNGHAPFDPTLESSLTKSSSVMPSPTGAAVTERADAAPTSGTLLLDSPLTELLLTSDGPDDSAKVYDIFWQDVPGEHRVRDRLRRRSPKEDA